MECLAHEKRAIVSLEPAKNDLPKVFCEENIYDRVHRPQNEPRVTYNPVLQCCYAIFTMYAFVAIYFDYGDGIVSSPEQQEWCDKNKDKKAYFKVLGENIRRLVRILVLVWVVPQVSRSDNEDFDITVQSDCQRE